jgi:hypothetical protein
VMRRVVIDLDDPAMKSALDEIESLIRDRFPEAVFSRYVDIDPAGAYLDVELDIDDTLPFYRAFGDRLNELILDGLHSVYVSVRQPRNRGFANGAAATAVTPRRSRRKAATPPA